MGKWILLTRISNGSELAVNLDHVREIVRIEHGSRINFADGHEEAVTAPLEGILKIADEVLHLGAQG
ncbi:MAG TPA: hypothetical protein VKB67_04795 [Rhizomicrobium sp.]|nr:hypothetical protein [Rhizomicrobium sp.]